MSKELKRMPCLGNVWLQEFGFLARGLLAGGLLAGGWKGLYTLKNKMRPNPAAAAWCQSANPCWVSRASENNLVSLRHWMALPGGEVQGWVLSMFPLPPKRL